MAQLGWVINCRPWSDASISHADSAVDAVCCRRTHECTDQDAVRCDVEQCLRASGDQVSLFRHPRFELTYSQTLYKAG